MNSRELRIGNYVRLMLNHSDYNDIQIELPDLNLIHNKNSRNEYRPIPITEELLLKCGFEIEDSDEENKWLNLRYGNLVFCADESTDFERVYFRIYNKDIICESLHQLQNLYYALTNNELNINL